jgi:hypothetical protein
MRKWVGAALGAAMVVSVAPAMAATTASLDLTRTGYGSGYVGQSETFQVILDGQTVNATATAWTWNGSNSNTISNSAVLGLWDKGLGVETRSSRNRVASSDNHTNGHTIDNKGSYDFVVFQFDQVVQFDSATLTAFNLGSNLATDIDFSVGATTTNIAWNSILGVADIAALLGGSYDNVHSTGTIKSGNTYTADLDLTGNLLFFGAGFDQQDTKFKTNRNDGFKLGALGLSTVPAVPEPATWAMMIAGFGLVGGAMRRRRPTATRVTA